MNFGSINTLRSVCAKHNHRQTKDNCNMHTNKGKRLVAKFNYKVANAYCLTLYIPDEEPPPLPVLFRSSVELLDDDLSVEQPLEEAGKVPYRPCRSVLTMVATEEQLELLAIFSFRAYRLVELEESVSPGDGV